MPVAACGGATGVAVGGTGQATCSVTYNATGTTAVTAVYLGDANYSTSTSSVLSQVVGKASTLTILSSSVNPSKVGQSVTFTATATPVAPGSGIPTGNIEFLQGGVAIAACGGATGVAVNGSGTATCAVTYNAIGTYAITATYLGDGNYPTSTSTPVSQAVGQTATTTSLGSSVNPSVTGQSVTFTATATPVAPGSGTPTGNIEFLQAGVPVAACGGATGVAVNGSGTATCAVAFNATGSYNMTATYLGDTNYVTSTSSVVAQVVNKAATTTTLGSSVNPSVTGQSVTFTGTVAASAPGSGTPTGNIEFLQAGVPVAACGGATGVAVNGSGVATCAVAFSATGTYAMTATYLGSANFSTSTSSAVSQVVNKAATTTTLGSSVNPSVTGQSVTFTGTVAASAPGSGTPTGNIEFLQAGVPVAACGGATGVAVGGTGQATCSVTYNATGTTAVTAVYLGDANFSTSTSPVLSQVVGKASTLTILSSSVNPSKVGQSVTFTATATPVAPGSGIPTGNIEFLQGGVAIAACGGATGVAVNGSGTATCAVTYNAIGTYAITATYLGDGNYLTSTSTPVSQAVGQTATTTSLGSSVNPSVTGQSVTFTATATPVAPGSGTPTGNIEFLQAGVPVAACGGATGVAVNGSGTATCAVAFNATGSYNMTATYLGDTNYVTSTSSVVAQVVNKAATTTTLGSSVNPSVTGQSVPSPARWPPRHRARARPPATSSSSRPASRSPPVAAPPAWPSTARGGHLCGDLQRHRHLRHDRHLPGQRQLLHLHLVGRLPGGQQGRHHHHPRLLGEPVGDRPVGDLHRHGGRLGAGLGHAHRQHRVPPGRRPGRRLWRCHRRGRQRLGRGHLCGGLQRHRHLRHDRHLPGQRQLRHLHLGARLPGGQQGLDHHHPRLLGEPVGDRPVGDLHRHRRPPRPRARARPPATSSSSRPASRSPPVAVPPAWPSTARGWPPVRWPSAPPAPTP